MLTDAQVERYARQIVLPEVGGRGQERLLASRAVLVGDGGVRRDLADLLTRAGVQVDDGDPQRPGSILFDLRLDGVGPALYCVGSVVLARGGGSQVTLTTLPAAPCPSCVAGNPQVANTAALDVLARHALAALAATEGLLVLLDPRRTPRRQRLDLSAGTFTSEVIAALPCSHGGYAHE